MTNKKSLIIYFSRAGENYSVGYIEKGNTEVVAEYIQKITGANIFRVERKVPYSNEYRKCVEEVQREQENNEKPELVSILNSIDEYEIIYIGSPVYCGKLPQPLAEQLELLNWKDKILMPFTTHEGSGFGNILNQLGEICKGAKIQNGLAIKGSLVNSSKEQIEKWVL